MEITEVRIKLVGSSATERLRAFASVIFDDCFVVRDLKIIAGNDEPFVAMPSRKLTCHCKKCRTNNHLRAVYCNDCGTPLEDNRAPKDADGRAKLYADVAHPINFACREMIQTIVMRAYNEELVRSKQTGYVSCYDSLDSDHYSPPDRQQERRRQPPAPKPAAVPLKNSTFGAGILSER